MMRVSGLLATLFVALMLGAVPAAQTSPGGTLQQEGFTPIDQLPPQDQLPAAPLLIAAYVFVVAILFVYLFSVAKRLGSVQQQVARIEGDMKRAKHG